MSDALKVLIELARLRGEAAARALAAEIAAGAECERRTLLIEEYAREYAERFARAGRDGSRAEALARLQRFVRRIEIARAQQAREAAAGAERIEAARRSWQEAERRKRSFEAVAARRARAIERVRLRAERRAEDEIAMQRALSRITKKEVPT